MFHHLFLKEKILQANMKSEDRVEERRFLKRMQQQKKEEEIQEAIENVLKRESHFCFCYLIFQRKLIQVLDCL